MLSKIVPFILLSIFPNFCHVSETQRPAGKYKADKATELGTINKYGNLLR